jgi:hypothetical protein
MPGRDNPGRLKLTPGKRRPGKLIPGKEIPGRATATGPSGVLMNSNGDVVALFKSTIFEAAIVGTPNDGVFEIGTAMTEALWSSISIRLNLRILKRS